MKFWDKLSNKSADDYVEQVITDASVKDDVSNVSEEDVEILIDKEEAITKKLSGTTSLKKYLELGRLMLALVKDSVSGKYKQVPWYTIATITMALLYVLNPMDLIPDFIPGLGYLDDLTVLSIGLGWIESDLHRYLDWKLAKNTSTE